MAAVVSRNTRRSGKLASAAIFALGFCCLPCLAQNAAPKTNATVTSDTLAVHAQMDDSSPVVHTLKKGAALFMDFQIAGSTGNWCGVRLPGQGARLGYVDCASLSVQVSHPPPGPASPAEFVGQPGVSAAQPPPAIHLSISPRSSRYADAYNRIKDLVVHDDEVDTLKMQQLDRQAQSGTPAAMNRAALAHIAAAQFDLSVSSRDEAIGEFHSAVKLSAQNPRLRFVGLLGLGYVHLLRSQYVPASQFLAQAQEIDPHTAVVAELLGWSDYGLNRLTDAVAQLQKAQRLQPNPEAAAMLAKVRKDQETERGFGQQENNHFILRYEGGATPELAESILNALEGDFETLQAALEFTPAQPIDVILYTDRTFRDVTRAPSWSGAINDGRIRIPVQGLTGVTPTLARELRHELTHSFVRQMTDGRCPTWLNEGLAQYFEGRNNAQDAQILVNLYKEKKYIPFNDLEGSWLRFPTPVAVYSYAWSLAAVESIVANSGMYGIERMFVRLKEEDSAQMALERALQLSYSDLALQTVEYLQNTYLH